MRPPPGLLAYRCRQSNQLTNAVKPARASSVQASMMAPRSTVRGVDACPGSLKCWRRLGGLLSQFSDGAMLLMVISWNGTPRASPRQGGFARPGAESS